MKDERDLFNARMGKRLAEDINAKVAELRSLVESADLTFRNRETRDCKPQAIGLEAFLEQYNLGRLDTELSALASRNTRTAEERRIARNETGLEDWHCEEVADSLSKLTR